MSKDNNNMETIIKSEQENKEQIKLIKWCCKPINLLKYSAA